LSIPNARLGDASIRSSSHIVSTLRSVASSLRHSVALTIGIARQWGDVVNNVSRHTASTSRFITSSIRRSIALCTRDARPWWDGVDHLGSSHFASTFRSVALLIGIARHCCD
jgi:hypothetical protein